MSSPRVINPNKNTTTITAEIIPKTENPECRTLSLSNLFQNNSCPRYSPHKHPMIESTTAIIQTSTETNRAIQQATRIANAMISLNRQRSSL